MIGKQYKKHKENVIEIYDIYLRKRGNINDGNDLEFLDNQIQSLKSGIFKLSVAGEVKAGKSTFLNALLGDEILPADILQASNAIVEIFKSDKSYLKIKYADDRIETIYDDPSTPDIDEAKSKLHEICCISEKYRGIPTTLIDHYIIESTEKIDVTTDFINILISKSGEQNLKAKDIKEYIDNRPKSSIPTEIEFGYPLKWDFDELRIIDSPGVNAIGGVQDVSFQFFEEANAILFIHPIKPVESKSFKDFVNEIISNRSKEFLYLILTHAGLVPETEAERLHKEAVRIYSKIIPKDRIIAVDSLFKIIHDNISSGMTIEEIERDPFKDNVLPTCQKRAQRENKNLKDVTLECSNFKKLYKSVDRFLLEAPYLQLSCILEKIKSGYDEIIGQYQENLSHCILKKKAPQEFEAEIIKIQNSLEKFKLIMNKKKEEVNSKFKGRNEFERNIDKIKFQYPKLIGESNKIEIARKHTTDIYNDLISTINNFSKSITDELNTILKEAGRPFQEEFKINIPKIDLAAIEEKAKNNAYVPNYEKETQSVWKSWNWIKFKWTKNSRTKNVLRGKRYDENEHLNAFRSDCIKDLAEIIDILPDKAKSNFDIHMSLFLTNLSSAIEDKNKALEIEKINKQNNEELINTINTLENNIKILLPEILRINTILEDVK